VYFASELDDHRFPVYERDFEDQATPADRLHRPRGSGVRVLPGHVPNALRPGLVAL
jgi:hypothetical protein